MAGDTKYAVLGDIHGNLDALEAVLDHAHSLGIHRFACVGDLVGYNASPGPCITRIREIGAVTIQGNHDYFAATDEPLKDFSPLAASVIEWTRHVLTTEQKEYLKSLRLKRMCDGFMMVHSTLDNPGKWGYVFDEVHAADHFAYQTAAICFHGHTHIPAVFRKIGERTERLPPEPITFSFGSKLFVNVGSVGQPRDNDPRACYVIYDSTSRSITFHRVAYNVAAAQKRILEAGLPERLALRLALGK
jgi:diadenosine tetraphosphatase ApaH/serine/threonine PP2A family protein phosphatase